MAYRGRYEKKKVKKSAGNGKRVALIIAIVVVALLLALVIGAIIWYNSTLNLITRPDDTTRNLSSEEVDQILGSMPDLLPEEETDPNQIPYEELTKDDSETDKIVNIMLVGQNYREGEYSKLADTMILCTVNKGTKTLTLTSFMRDMYVRLPEFEGHGAGQNRINVAYNLGWHWGGELGGIRMLSKCIYENFGVVIDHTVEINFDDFIDVIDLLGGIELELSEAEARYLTNDFTNDGTFEPGIAVLNGEEALAYVRMRHADASDSDFNRTERQRKVISEILNKVKGMSITELSKLVQSVLPMVITDMTNDDITNYIMTLAPLLLDLKIESNRCPAEGTYSGKIVEIYGVQSGVLVPDLAKNRELLMAICEEAE